MDTDSDLITESGVHPERSHCATCGHTLRHGDAFCTHCGTSVTGEPRKPLFADEAEGYVSDHRPPPEPVRPVQPSARTAVLPTETAEEEPARRRRGGWLVALVAALVLLGAGIATGVYLGNRDATTPSADARGSGSPSAGSSSSSPTKPSKPSTPSETGGTGAPMQPQDQLALMTRRDAPAARKLVDRWVPQLAALTPGAGGDASWSQALEHFKRLRKAHPNVLLLDTADWPHSYEKGGMYAIVVPEPRSTSGEVLAWCRTHSPRQDCAAKNIATSGSWADNFKM